MAVAPQDIVRFVVTDTWDRAATSMRAAMAAAADGATQATSRQVLELLDVFERDVAASTRKEFFETLGRRAHGAVKKSYASRSRGPSGYRSGGQDEKLRRYSGGKLRTALGRPENIYRASSNGITFLPDIKQLDREARQWYRLNFGALPGSGQASQQFDVSISNIYLFSIGFRANPSEPFRIPRGFWIENGEPVPAGTPGTSAFYPRRAAAKIGHAVGRGKEEQKAATNFFPGRRTARGIQAEHFLDAGLRRFAEDIRDPGRSGVGLRGLYFRFYESGLAQVRPTRPPTIQVNPRR